MLKRLRSLPREKRARVLLALMLALMAVFLWPEIGAFGWPAVGVFGYRPLGFILALPCVVFAGYTLFVEGKG